jgi:hypothetical protein
MQMIIINVCTVILSTHCKNTFSVRQLPYPYASGRALLCYACAQTSSICMVGQYTFYHNSRVSCDPRSRSEIRVKCRVVERWTLARATAPGSQCSTDLVAGHVLVSFGRTSPARNTQCEAITSDLYLHNQYYPLTLNITNMFI